SANRAKFRAGKPSIHREERNIVPVPFIFSLSFDFPESSIVNALGELGFRHPPHIQRFENKCFVITNQIRRYFMSEIISLMGNALMGSGKSFSRFCSILRASYFSTQTPIQFSDLSLTSTKELQKIV